MQPMSAFVRLNKIRMTYDWADSNPNMTDSQNMNHYKCTLKMGKKQITLFFSQGYGISVDPDAESVLDCLASDSASIENARSFEDWANEYGYNTDSRKAEKIFKACERQAEKLKSFLGDELYNSLLWKTERL